MARVVRLAGFAALQWLNTRVRCKTSHLFTSRARETLRALLRPGVSNMAKGSVKISKEDKKLREWIKRIGKNVKIKVGVLGTAPGRTKTKTESGGTIPTPQEVATWNEQGTSRIPARSFIRAPFEANAVANQAFAKEGLQRAVRGEYTFTQIMNRLGLRIVGQMVTAMSAGVAPANAASTIARKGSSKPLIDTGQMRSSVTYAIEGLPKERAPSTPKASGASKVLKRIGKLKKRIGKKQKKLSKAARKITKQHFVIKKGGVKSKIVKGKRPASTRRKRSTKVRNSGATQR